MSSSSRNDSASSSSKSAANSNEESSAQQVTQPNPEFNVTHYFQTNALKSQSTYVGPNLQYDNISSSKSQSDYLHSIISRAESELTKHNHQIVSDQTVYSTEEGADLDDDDDENRRKKRKRTNYKDPERLAVLTEAVDVLVGRLNSDQPLDMRSVSKRFNIPYNTLRDNYLK